MNIIQVNSTIKQKIKNVSVRNNKHKKHLHEILTPEENTERCIFVNRDKNACKHILHWKIFLENQLRPKEFSPKPKESNYKTKETKTEKRNCWLIKVID